MKYWIEVMMEKNIFITFEGNINIKDLNWLPPIFDSDTKWIDISRITTFEQVNQLLHHMILYNDVYFKCNNSQHDTMLRMIDIMNHHEMIYRADYIS